MDIKYLHSHGIRLQWSIRKLRQIFYWTRDGKIDIFFFDFLGVFHRFSINIRIEVQKCTLFSFALGNERTLVACKSLRSASRFTRFTRYQPFHFPMQTKKVYFNPLMCRCRIEFWPHGISTRGVLIQRAVLRIQRIFHVELRPPETGGHCITTPPTDKIWTPVELWPPGLDSTLNYDPRSWFYVECWSRVMIQH